MGSVGLGRCCRCHLLSLTALAVESFPAMTFTPVASRPEDAHALVHARVGFAQVHRAFCFCNKHRQNSGVRHIDGVLIVKCTSISSASENNDSNLITQSPENVIWGKQNMKHTDLAECSLQQTPLCLIYGRERLALLHVLILKWSIFRAVCWTHKHL